GRRVKRREGRRGDATWERPRRSEQHGRTERPFCSPKVGMAEEAHLHHFFVSCVHSAAFRRLNRPPSPFVHVVARLPPASLARLRAVLTANDELVEVVSWHELSSVLRSQPIDLIVLDPRARGDEPGTQDRDEPSVL